MVKAIIPCAGFGTRMGMPAHESKEMLNDPNNPAKYLIDYSLELCYKYNIEPVVITRPEKEDLINYLTTYRDCELVICKPGKEWAETVLKSQGLWGEKNILILPDTRFDEDAIPKLLNDLTWNHHSDIVAAVHEIDPEDCKKWGGFHDNMIAEKSGNKTNAAWGILGWNNKWPGVDLLSELVPGGHYIQEDPIPYIKLDKFVDITRSGTLEKY